MQEPITILALIQDLMLSDDEDSTLQTQKLYEIWHSADAIQLETLNQAFIALCGYGLSTLFNNPPTDEAVYKGDKEV